MWYQDFLYKFVYKLMLNIMILWFILGEWMSQVVVRKMDSI